MHLIRSPLWVLTVWTLGWNRMLFMKYSPFILACHFSVGGLGHGLRAEQVKGNCALLSCFYWSYWHEITSSQELGKTWTRTVQRCVMDSVDVDDFTAVCSRCGFPRRWGRSYLRSRCIRLVCFTLTYVVNICVISCWPHLLMLVLVDSGGKTDICYHSKTQRTAFLIHSCKQAILEAKRPFKTTEHTTNYHVDPHLP